MLEKISEKIEAIRQQPESIRIRYVWGCVAASMFIILIFWIFSIASMFAGGKDDSDQTANGINSSISEQIQTLSNQAPSLKDLNSQPLTTDDINSIQNMDDIQSSTGTSAEIESSVYSDLPNINSTQ